MPEDTTPTGTTIELAPLGSNSLTDAYWLIGQVSIDEVIQQSHGVPALLWFGCRDEEEQPAETTDPTPSEEEPSESEEEPTA